VRGGAGFDILDLLALNMMLYPELDIVDRTIAQGNDYQDGGVLKSRRKGVML
jgi:hypothetical protein